MKEKLSGDNLKSYALTLIKNGEKLLDRFNLTNKLKFKAAYPEEISALIDQLKAEGYNIPDKKPLKISWRAWCLYKLAERDYSCNQMEELMKKRAAKSGEQVDTKEVIEGLARDRFLDDERYTENAINYRANSLKKGPIEIRNFLKNKAGISDELINRFLDDSDEIWQEKAYKIRERLVKPKYLDEEVQKGEESVEYKKLIAIKRKLYTKGFNSQQIEYALRGLKIISQEQQKKAEKEYSDLEIEKLIEKRISQGKGPIEIKQFLKGKGIEESKTVEFLSYYEEDWADLARVQRDARFGGLTSTPAVKAKQIRYLQSRGFSMDHIFKIIDK